MHNKKDIKDFKLTELERAMVDINEPAYRARQIFFWLYQKGIRDFGEIKNMPRPFIDKLKKNYYISSIESCGHLRSSDGTEKFLFKLRNNCFIESVVIYAKRRKTLCLSTQAGCRFRCSFCASGLNGFTRNLTTPEIINQILYLCYNLQYKITNYVFMGMGEPLDNYENVAKAIKIMNEPKGMAIGARRITVSTCGIIPGIERLRDAGLQINLSVSLHAVNDKVRNILMPVNKRYPFKKLIKACEDFKSKTGRMVTIEYVLIKGINDSTKDIDELAVIAKRLKSKINLISYSTVSGLCFRAPGYRDIDILMRRLIGKGVNVILRESKGKDIKAACGQLAGR